ncbi:MAG TPA: BON domain-containing protein [Gammaproteobacteria bacterium]|nr:BON domain-containing protein [Gammaproteobacteria bacterium]
MNNELQVTGEQASLGDKIAEGMSDAALTAKVKSRLLASENTSGLKIDVDANDDTVTLSGEVESDTERELAVMIAANTAGVEDVRDNLSIERY